eukprot:2915064-Pyramimonas_sp.AAC.1
MKGGMGRAHRWTKKLEAWKPVPAVHRQRFSGRPPRILQVEADRLANIQDVHTEAPPQWVSQTDDRVALGPSTPARLRKVCRSFPRNTGSTWDGVHPRHFAMLDDAQAELVCKMIELIEQIGHMPSQLQ